MFLEQSWQTRGVDPKVIKKLRTKWLLPQSPYEHGDEEIKKVKQS